MKGIVSISLETRRLSYSLTFERNLNVILGDSATGKSTLINYINHSRVDKKNKFKCS